MSTRATIAYKQDDGRYRAIYLHFDAYPDRLVPLLQRHHGSPDRASELVAGGDLRSLEHDGTAERFADGNRAVLMPTRSALLDFARNCSSEYLYLFEDGVWSSTELIAR